MILDQRGADAEQSRDLLVAAAGGGHQVEVIPVFTTLPSGTGMNSRLKPWPATILPSGSSGWFGSSGIPPARYLAPELGLAVGVGAIDENLRTSNIRVLGIQVERARRAPELAREWRSDARCLRLLTWRPPLLLDNARLQYRARRTRSPHLK